MQYDRSALTDQMLRQVPTMSTDAQNALDRHVQDTIASVTDIIKRCTSIVDALNSDDWNDVMYAVNRLADSVAIDQQLTDARVSAVKISTICRTVDGIY